MGGIGSSIISLLTIWLAFPTWGSIVYPKLATFPDWAAAMVNSSLPIVEAPIALNATTVLVNATTALVNATLH